MSLVDKIGEELKADLYGNPHSASPSASLSTNRIDAVRFRLLNFFKANPQQFDIVFVANATAAIKLVAELFRDQSSGFWYGYHGDSHTSLVGIRQLAQNSRCFGRDSEVEEWLEGDIGQTFTKASLGLFAYPAQSNMNGRRLNLRWPGEIRRKGQRIYTLLDAAAYAMTAELDLSNDATAPDFVAISLYKIFGLPDLGVLIVRNTAIDLVKQRRYFGGGTVDMITVMQDPWVARKHATIHDQLEDGTLPVHQIIALDSALTTHAEIFGSMANVSQYTSGLALDLYQRLANLRHWNNHPLCVIYKDPSARYGQPDTQGPTVAFNLQNSSGGWVPKTDVEMLAAARNIHLRTGGLCNPGGIASNCQLADWELRRNFAEGVRCGNEIDVVGGKTTGVIRASLGAMSSSRDVNRLVELFSELFLETAPGNPIFRPSSVGTASGKLRVQILQIFPIVGCPGWRIPRNHKWQVTKTGLAWDREWCIVSRYDGRPLDPSLYPQMKSIHPELDLEKGTLKLTFPAEAISAPSEMLVSIWDDPVLSVKGEKIDLHSEDLAKFLSAIFGVPCTLGRYPRVERIAKLEDVDSFVAHRVTSDQDSSPIQLLFDILSTVGSDASCSVALSGLPAWDAERYISIGPHYFELYSLSDSHLAGNIRGMSFLGNLSDRSPESQNPTISSNDSVQLWSKEYDSNLQQVISSQHLGEHICAVWNCGKDFITRNELYLHYSSQECQPNQSSPKSSQTLTGDSLFSAKKVSSVKNVIFREKSRGNPRGLKELWCKVWRHSLKT